MKRACRCATAWALAPQLEVAPPPKRARPATLRTSPRRRALAAEQLLLWRDIFLRDVARPGQRLNAALGELGAVALEAHVQELGAEAILVAELIIVPLTFLLHRGRHGDRCRERGTDEARNRKERDRQAGAIGSHGSKLPLKAKPRRTKPRGATERKPRVRANCACPGIS